MVDLPEEDPEGERALLEAETRVWNLLKVRTRVGQGQWVGQWMDQWVYEWMDEWVSGWFRVERVGGRSVDGDHAYLRTFFCVLFVFRMCVSPCQTFDHSLISPAWMYIHKLLHTTSRSWTC